MLNNTGIKREKILQHESNFVCSRTSSFYGCCSRPNSGSYRKW